MGRSVSADGSVWSEGGALLGRVDGDAGSSPLVLRCMRPDCRGCEHGWIAVVDVPVGGCPLVAEDRPPCADGWHAGGVAAECPTCGALYAWSCCGSTDPDHLPSRCGVSTFTAVTGVPVEVDASLPAEAWQLRDRSSGEVLFDVRETPWLVGALERLAESERARVRALHAAVRGASDADPVARAEVVLTAHQRVREDACLCGWSDPGRSHAGHQVAMLLAAGLVVGDG